MKASPHDASIETSGMALRGRAAVAAVALTLWGGRAFAQEAQLSPDLVARVDAIFARFDAEDAPGCAVGVVKDGELVLARAYGMADLEQGIALTPASIFELASESKHFTAAAVLVAAREGALSLDDDLRKHVPEIPDYGHTITLRQLLHHTSGIRDYGTLGLLSGINGYPRTADEALALLAEQRELNYRPGEHYSYSNSGYFLLGVALERATGRSLREFADEQLLAPLGMKDTHFADDRYAILPGRAEGHVRLRRGGLGRVGAPGEVVGAAGIVSTVEDLALWERAFHEGTIGGGIVPDLLVRGELNDGSVLPYAAGLVVEDFDGMPAVSHGGEGGGFGSFLLRFPDVGLSVICLSNRSGNGVPGLAWRTAVAFLYGPYREETLRRQTRSEPPAYVELPDEKLRRWAGSYRDPRTRSMRTVSVFNGSLVVQSGGGRSLLKPLSETRFRTPEPGQTVVADFRDDGLRIEVEGQHPSTFRRIELVDPAEVSLDDYAGAYQNEELRITWTFETRDGGLYFAGIGAPPEPLQPTTRDEFEHSAELRFTFERDDSGRVSSMLVHTDRVWALRFALK